MKTQFEFLNDRIDEQVNGVFASLDTLDSTAIATAGTYYPIEGDFTNSPMVGFGVGTSSINYTGTETRSFEIDWHSTVHKLTGNSTILIGLKKNTTVDDRSIMGTLVTTVALQMSGTAVVQLSTGDSITLVVTSDSSTDTIAVDYFTTTIRPFITQ